MKWLGIVLGTWAVMIALLAMVILGSRLYRLAIDAVLEAF